MTAPDHPARAIPVRDAASIVLLRRIGGVAHVLMGRRPAQSAFMPDIYVFPGGAVDAGDGAVPLAAPLPAQATAAIAAEGHGAPHAVAAAAIRELWEETGLRLARPAPWPDAPADWSGFAAGDFRPDAGALRYIFRAITPQGRPRRFDARFFLADAAALTGDPDRFAATTELSDRRWVPLTDTPLMDIAPVTGIVLMQVARQLQGADASPVPCFDASDRKAAERLAAEIRQQTAPFFPTPFPPKSFD